MPCSVCGEKALYRAGDREFCVNHKQIASRLSAGVKQASQPKVFDCACGRQFKASENCTNPRCGKCNYSATQPRANSNSRKSKRNSLMQGKTFAKSNHKESYGFGVWERER
jgi:hypothetical protein